MRRIDGKFGLNRLLFPGVAVLAFATLSAVADLSNRRTNAGVGTSADDPCLTRFSVSRNAAAAAVIRDHGRDHEIIGRLYPAGQADAGMAGRPDRGSYPHAATLFRDLDGTMSANARKTAFISAVLPMVLNVNEKILDQRRLVEAAVACGNHGRLPGPALQKRIQGLHERYGTDGDLDALLHQMDVVPPSLAIAQAAIESGWGTSRFVVLGNALFGQRTTNPARGMRPTDLPDTTRVRVAAFDHLMASVGSYVHNLNTHSAYRAFRDRRAMLRQNGKNLDGLALAGTLVAYSTRRQAYVRDLRSIIRANRLTAFDAAAPAAALHGWTSGSET